ncbi:unnamed protein product [Sphenostylis stenocarpa]|uniref:Uncharacterized protein n=1 Tax=Sphenostylis stenocarpa TaxID=92480 RepID=A0AA86S1S4_9FABA|nr:unnamed protein product [Sphenostylis stenocarpa]
MESQQQATKGCTRLLQECKARTMLERPGSKLPFQTLSQTKIILIPYESMIHVSDIKLTRTDTTLYLSQKAEKGMLYDTPGRHRSNILG